MHNSTWGIHTCIIVHGFYGTPSSVRGLADFLSSNYKTVTPLLPGHGTHPDDLRGISWVDWLAFLYRRCRRAQAHGGKVFYIGLSLGGTLGLYIAALWPEVCDGIITINAPVVMPHWQQAGIGMYNIFNLSYTPAIGPAEDWDGYRTNIPGSAMREFLLAVTAARLNLHRLSQPLMIMQSLRDTTILPRNGRYIAAHAYNATSEIHEIDSSSHCIATHPEHKDDIFKRCLCFLEKI